MQSFQGVKRRLELRGTPGGVSVYDDFAHHPTAIENTLAAVRQHQPGKKLVAVIEPRSNTMRSGVHAGELIAATESADQIFWYQPPDMSWSLADIVETSARPTAVLSTIDELVAATADAVGPGDTVVIMSNGGFNQFHERLLAFLEDR
jgi:UDP-N-acetylmuramate: L-alanyl-gamma-D-glutamyl-meso-diaminopimelate ligase